MAVKPVMDERCRLSWHGADRFLSARLAHVWRLSAPFHFRAVSASIQTAQVYAWTDNSDNVRPQQISVVEPYSRTRTSGETGPAVHTIYTSQREDQYAVWGIQGLNGFDASRYSALAFEVMGKTGTRLAVKLADRRACESKEYPVTLAASGWQTVSVPLDSVTSSCKLDLTLIDVVTFAVCGQVQRGLGNRQHPICGVGPMFRSGSHSCAGLPVVRNATQGLFIVLVLTVYVVLNILVGVLLINWSYWLSLLQFLILQLMNLGIAYSIVEISFSLLVRVEDNLIPHLETLVTQPRVALLYVTCDDAVDEALSRLGNQTYPGVQIFILDDSAKRFIGRNWIGPGCASSGEMIELASRQDR